MCSDQFSSHTAQHACRDLGENIRCTFCACVAVCMCWRMKLRIIESHDRTPYKLLDFFIHPYTHIPLTPFFLKASFDFDPTLHHERHLCQSLCLSRLDPPPLHPPPNPPTPFSIWPSSPHWLIAGSALLRFSQHGKTLSSWGRNVSTPYIQSWEKRHFLSYSLI